MRAKEKRPAHHRRCEAEQTAPSPLHHGSNALPLSLINFSPLVCVMVSCVLRMTTMMCNAATRRTKESVRGISIGKVYKKAGRRDSGKERQQGGWKAGEQEAMQAGRRESGRRRRESGRKAATPGCLIEAAGRPDSEKGRLGAGAYPPMPRPHTPPVRPRRMFVMARVCACSTDLAIVARQPGSTQ